MWDEATYSQINPDFNEEIIKCPTHPTDLDHPPPKALNLQHCNHRPHLPCIIIRRFVWGTSPVSRPPLHSTCMACCINWCDVRPANMRGRSSKIRGVMVAKTNRDVPPPLMKASSGVWLGKSVEDYILCLLLVFIMITFVPRLLLEEIDLPSSGSSLWTPTLSDYYHHRTG